MDGVLERCQSGSRASEDARTSSRIGIPASASAITRANVGFGVYALFQKGCLEVLAEVCTAGVFASLGRECIYAWLWYAHVKMSRCSLILVE